MKVIEQQRTIISNPNSIFAYFGWPTIARLNSGELALTCSGYRLRHVCPFGKACISYSKDDGKTWTKAMPIIDTYLDDRDSGICVKGDKVILTSFNNKPEFQKKWIEDAEKRGDKSTYVPFMKAYTETYPDDVVERFYGSTYKISNDGGYTFGELKRSIVTSPHGPFVKNDGTIMWIGKLFEDGNVKSNITVTEMNENDEFIKKAEIEGCFGDGGEELLSCEPDAIQMPNGTILVGIRAQNEKDYFTIYLSKSYDDGKTFTKPFMLIPKMAGSPPHFMLTKDNRVVLTYACRHGNIGIRAIVSDDFGETFGDEIVLTSNRPRPDLGYPCTIQRNDGSLLTIWYEKGDEGSTIEQMIWKL